MNQNNTFSNSMNTTSISSSIACTCTINSKCAQCQQTQKYLYDKYSNKNFYSGNKAENSTTGTILKENLNINNTLCICKKNQNDLCDHCTKGKANFKPIIAYNKENWCLYCYKKFQTNSLNHNCTFQKKFHQTNCNIITLKVNKKNIQQLHIIKQQLSKKLSQYGYGYSTGDLMACLQKIYNKALIIIKVSPKDIDQFIKKQSKFFYHQKKVQQTYKKMSDYLLKDYKSNKSEKYKPIGGQIYFGNLQQIKNHLQTSFLLLKQQQIKDHIILKVHQNKQNHEIQTLKFCLKTLLNMNGNELLTIFRNHRQISSQSNKNWTYVTKRQFLINDYQLNFSLIQKLYISKNQLSNIADQTQIINSINTFISKYNIQYQQYSFHKQCVICKQDIWNKKDMQQFYFKRKCNCKTIQLNSLYCQVCSNSQNYQQTYSHHQFQPIKNKICLDISCDKQIKLTKFKLCLKIQEEQIETNRCLALKRIEYIKNKNICMYEKIWQKIQQKSISLQKSYRQKVLILDKQIKYKIELKEFSQKMKMIYEEAIIQSKKRILNCKKQKENQSYKDRAKRVFSL